MTFSKLFKFFGPYFVVPIIPKVTVMQDGFVLNKKKVNLDDIVSVFYRNTHSPNNTVFPLVGASRYEILTNNNLLFVYGEHFDLAELFNKKLEAVTRVEDKTSGLTLRWKRAGGDYKPVSIRDVFGLHIIEPLSLKQISSNWLKNLIICFIITFLFLALWFIYKLYNPFS